MAAACRKPLRSIAHNLRLEKFKDKYLSGSEFSSYPYWIAHYYKTSLEYDDAWSFWQHADIGAVPGIKGDVDMDVFNGNAEDLSMMLLK